MATTFLCVGLAAVPAIGAQEQAEAPLTLNDLVNVDFRSDIRVFTVMAALNVAGFDYETAGKEMSFVRRELRKDLERLNPLVVGRLHDFFERRKVDRPLSEKHVPYISLALLIGGPPEFSFGTDYRKIPGDAGKVLGFEELLGEFYRTADIPKHWAKYEPIYEAELTAYKPVLRDAIEETLRYFKMPPRLALDRKIILIPDLLGPRDIVNARNLEDTYYMVLGPADHPAENYTQLQHEYLHFLLDPLIDKYGAGLLRHEKLLDLAQSQPNIGEEYQNKFLLLVTESLIESLILRLRPPQDRDRKMVELFREGLIFAPYFERGLKLYERSELISLPVYLESLFQGIQPDEIKKDEQAVVEIEKRFRGAEQERVQAQAEARRAAERKQEINTLLNEAGRLIAQDNYPEATKTLESMLKLDPGNGNAYFYLAQIATQQRAYDQALQYYEKVLLDSKVMLWVQAWTHLKIGNILAFQDKLEEARRSYQAILELEGDLQGAREEAEKSLQRLSEN